MNLFFLRNAACVITRKETSWNRRKCRLPNLKRKLTILRTMPTIVIAHTFCASRDTRISYRRCLLIQGYFCAVQNYAEKAELCKCSLYPNRKLGVTTHFSEKIKLQFGKERHKLLCILKLFWVQWCPRLRATSNDVSDWHGPHSGSSKGCGDPSLSLQTSRSTCSNQPARQSFCMAARAGH